MLPNHAPLTVAERFKVLEALFPGRIDLGLGRAPGTDGLTMFALQRDRREASPDDFPQQLAELLGYLDGTLPADHPFARLAGTLPGLPERPEPWLLGSSPQSAIWAGELGLPYSFADFINPAGAEIAALYRQNFKDTEAHPVPVVSAAVWAICAETTEEAQQLAASARMSFRLLRQGKLIPVPPPEKAQRFLEQQDGGESSAPVPGRDRRAVIGNPDKVREGIEQVARDYGAQEVMVVTITYDHAARRRSYELIAEAFGLDASLREAAQATSA
jgi:luciferase family oxidoreductase group 1